MHECWLALKWPALACLVWTNPEEATAGRSCPVAELGEALAPSELDEPAQPLGAHRRAMEALEDQAGVDTLLAVLHEPVGLPGQPSLKK